jgi:ABC-type transporter Mla MlaB component
MVLKIELLQTGSGTVLTLIGRITSHDVQRLKAQLADLKHSVALDLGQVHLVDLDAVHFLAESQRMGVELRRLPPYVREWIRLETKQLEGMDDGTHAGGGLRQRNEGL